MFTYSFQMISWHTMPDTGLNTPIIHNVMYDATQKKEDVNDQTIDGRDIDLSGDYIGIKCRVGSVHNRLLSLFLYAKRERGRKSKVLGLFSCRVGCLSSRLFINNTPNCSKALSVQCFLWLVAC